MEVLQLGFGRIERGLGRPLIRLGFADGQARVEQPLLGHDFRDRLDLFLESPRLAGRLPGAVEQRLLEPHVGPRFVVVQKDEFLPLLHPLARNDFDLQHRMQRHRRDDAAAARSALRQAAHIERPGDRRGRLRFDWRPRDGAWAGRRPSGAARERTMTPQTVQIKVRISELPPAGRCVVLCRKPTSGSARRRFLNRRGCCQKATCVIFSAPQGAAVRLPPAQAGGSRIANIVLKPPIGGDGRSGSVAPCRGFERQGARSSPPARAGGKKTAAPFGAKSSPYDCLISRK